MPVTNWFALDCTIHTHPKTLRLAELLKIDVDTAVGKLARLWSWAKQNGVEDGDIGFLPPGELADIMRWKKKPAVLLAALTECGFLDKTDSGISMHGWVELNGRLQAKKRADRERKTRGNSADFPRTIQGKSAPTIPDHTRPMVGSGTKAPPPTIAPASGETAEGGIKPYPPGAVKLCAYFEEQCHQISSHPLLNAITASLTDGTTEDMLRTVIDETALAGADSPARYAVKVINRLRDEKIRTLSAFRARQEQHRAKGGKTGGTDGTTDAFDGVELDVTRV